MVREGCDVDQTQVTGCPWTFQSDIYGMLNVVHCLLHNDYMEVEQDDNQKWMPRKKFKRYWQQDMWKLLFSNLLNIRDCDSIPPLRVYREAMENYLYDPQVKERQLSLQRSLHKQNLMMFEQENSWNGDLMILDQLII